MGSEEVSIRTEDGECRAFVFTPDEPGSHPAVIVYTDAFGIRPTSLAIGRRLAEHGYVALVPDLFYRAGPYEPLDPGAAFASGDIGAALGKLRGATDNRRGAADSKAFLDYLASRDDVAGTRVGVTGYCMGGAIALTVAGTYPDRVAAAAGFHAGNLVTDSDQSPHLVAPEIEGTVYVGGADHDHIYPPEMAARLDSILTEAGVEHRLEIYPDVLHGFTMKDFPVYDEAADRRHWSELLALLDRTLAQPV